MWNLIQQNPDTKQKDNAYKYKVIFGVCIHVQLLLLDW